MNQDLKEAAEAGNINNLYELIRRDAYLLEHLDQVPFVETPLHAAASTGQIEFAMEIMNLKASFAGKLNQDGFSPMHLAVQKGRTLMVLWLLDVDPDLVRVKGRGGKTPLHCAVELGDVAVLTEIFEACPESIKDVTNEGDTAFHVALKNNHVEAFQVLLGWLQRCVFRDALFWRRQLLNWKNKEGNTALHIALSRNLLPAAKLLAELPVYGDINNEAGATAIAILKGQIQGKEVLRKLRHRPKLGHATPCKDLTSAPSICEAQTLWLERRRNTLPIEKFNLLVVVHTLIATITFQAALSPPGGVWQGQADINSPLRNIVHVNASAASTRNEAEASSSRYVGTTIMGSVTFTLFWLANTSLFFVTVQRIIRQEGAFLLFSCYLLSMSVISPNKAWSNINIVLFFSIALYYLPQWCYRTMSGYTHWRIGWRRRREPIHDRKEWWQQGD
uniref:Ankyrin repeat protein n=1 Tax=Bruguiera gymnorhiza TaxID=39984 RepID=B1Q4U3_BRUGY|nr:ankyrin repeat protein [Bruguiera gymnorhiza]